MEGTPYMEDDIIMSSTNSEFVDSDLEEDQKDFEENQFELTIEIDEAKVPSGAKVLVYGAKQVQALVRIVFDDDLEQIGKVMSKTGKEGKEKEALKIYAKQNLLIL